MSVNYFNNSKNTSGCIGNNSILPELRKPQADYEKKYKGIKKLIKAYLFENAALCDHVAQTQEKVLIAKEERNFLLRKLEQYEALRASLENKLGPATCPSNSLLDRNNVNNKRTAPKKRATSDAADNGKVGPSKPKRMLMAVRKRKLTQQIALDPAGRPIFPIVLGDLTVYSLGEVIYSKPNYHTEEFVYPVGFFSTREYTSLYDPDRKCLYTCKVSDGGNDPGFEISSDTDLEHPILGQTPDECHSRLLSLIRQNLGAPLMNLQPKGASFFGFSHPCILNLLQSFPNIRKCSKYVFTKFEACRSGESSDPIENDPALDHAALQRSLTFSRMNF